MRLAKYACCLMFIMISSAHAYVGPGPGLSMLGSLLTLLGGVVVALIMVLAYPIRLMMKRKKNKSPIDKQQ